MGQYTVNADLILGVGEFIKLDTSVIIEDSETVVTDVSADTPKVANISGNSLILACNSPINTDVLGGTPQTNVRLLVLLAEQ